MLGQWLLFHLEGVVWSRDFHVSRFYGFVKRVGKTIDMVFTLSGSQGFYTYH